MERLVQTASTRQRGIDHKVDQLFFSPSNLSNLHNIDCVTVHQDSPVMLFHSRINWRRIVYP